MIAKNNLTKNELIQNNKKLINRNRDLIKAVTQTESIHNAMLIYFCNKYGEDKNSKKTIKIPKSYYKDKEKYKSTVTVDDGDYVIEVVKKAGD